MTLGSGWGRPGRGWETGPMSDSPPTPSASPVSSGSTGSTAATGSSSPVAPTSAAPAPGPARAVVLDVWCELQCPDCRGALDDLRALRDRYGDRLELRLRHFPLEKHKHAFAAAQAAEEALEQGQGWSYVEAVLGRVEELDRRGEPFLVEVADELGLDAEEFDTALIDGRHILIVDADQAEGKAIGVTGTPTYVIGGERLDGGKTQEGLRRRIEEITDRLLSEQA
ncbi:DSBA oxidoreductase [Streptomyces humidus]|uniref:DSBA oxidoreductase n=2 Tax=Streptomyces humidus TaxID=52259 RepID=A0A918FTK8_9ACTN|nr:DSBA oxidoreductase [Streptomyces humidus]